MTFEKIYQLLKTHRTVTLITADNAALIISFLYKVFKQEQDGFIANTIAEKDLIEKLSDYLYNLNREETQFPREPKHYLTDWANAGYLRKFPTKNDEFLFELTPATENAFKWIDSLDKREFEGQESRLKNLFNSLKELSTKSKRDYRARIQELEKQKREIEAEIENVKLGKMEVLDDRQIKEQYFLIEETAKNLLADFRQVEQNFRDIDRSFRKKIITTSQSKGKVLEELFEQHDNLYDTDQGKSFIAFWEFLLSQSKQEEFEKLIKEVLDIQVIKDLQKENFNIGNVRNNLIEAGDRTKKSTNSLLEQLRKYLEHKTFFENKRIHENIQEILKIVSEQSQVDFVKLDLLHLDDVISVDLTLNRPLFTPPDKLRFAKNNPVEGVASGDNETLFEQFEISIAELRKKIKTALKSKEQISFVDFIKEYKITKGVAEVVAYVEIASKEKGKHVIKSSESEYIEVENSKTNKKYRVKIPQIIFCK
jgi:hypothetical protein